MSFSVKSTRKPMEPRPKCIFSKNFKEVTLLSVRDESRTSYLRSVFSLWTEHVDGRCKGVLYWGLLRFYQHIILSNKLLFLSWMSHITLSFFTLMIVARFNHFKLTHKKALILTLNCIVKNREKKKNIDFFSRLKEALGKVSLCHLPCSPPRKQDQCSTSWCAFALHILYTMYVGRQENNREWNC